MSINIERLNAYRIMWTIVMYDLPTETALQRKEAALFRKNLLKDGFNMFQFSLYLRHSASSENAKVHKNRVIKNLPALGKIGILQITDKQFGDMEIYYAKKPQVVKPGPQQLELF